MPISLPLAEPKTAEYIHIDSENRVHLLLPIVGGETVGLDNTCKTVMEMQTFFYGKEGKDKKPSALEVLSDYAIKLEQDIAFLQESGKFSELLAEKRHRLVQIQGYASILEKVKDRFVKADAAFPEFPKAIHTMLERQSNCITIHLSPEHPDYFLRTKSPVFSLARPPAVIRDGYYVDHPVDRYAGLGPSLRAHLRYGLGRSDSSSSNVKAQLIEEIGDYYKDKTKPTLAELQSYITRRVAEEFSQNVDLTKDSSGMVLDADYFENILACPYDDCSVDEAASYILGGALADQFWSGLKQNNIFRPDDKLTAEKNSEQLAMASEFFLANINIYCRAQGLSSKNFGPELDKKAEDIAKRIAATISANGSVEEELFKIINELKRPLGLSRALNDEDKIKIKAEFTVQYNTIKDSPHLDEFIFFLPEVQGDFFNHKNRISLPFLDLITTTLPDLRRDEQAAITQLMSAHQLQDNVRALKAKPLRALQANNPIATSTFQSFLQSINDRTYSHCANYLCSQIQKKSDLTTQLSFKELDALLNHPKWAQMERVIRSNPDLDKRAHYIQAIDYAKNHLAMMHEKLLGPQGGKVNLEAIRTPQKWTDSLASLEECIKSYKGKFFYRFKSDERKAQIKALDDILVDLKMNEGQSPAAKMQALNHALMSFNSLIQTIKESQPGKKSTLQGKIEATRERLLTLFDLSKTAIARKPEDPEQDLLDYENTVLGVLAEHKSLHHLNSSWLTKEGMAVIQQLPANYYTYDNVSFLNTTTSAQWDQSVLKAIQKDKVPFDRTFNFDALRDRGQFIMAIEARNLPAALQQSLLNLDKTWWSASTAIDKLVTLNLETLPEKVINFLNTIAPTQLDDHVVQGLAHRAASKQWTSQPLTVDLLRQEGKQHQLLGDLSTSHPILHQLKKEWWTESRIAAIKSLGPECFTQSVVNFLNIIQPEQLNKQLIQGIQRSNKTVPLDFRAVYSLGADHAPSVRAESTPIVQSPPIDQSNDVRTERRSPLNRHESLLAKINAAKAQYAAHTKNKWFDIGGERKAKNDIIQEELGKAVEKLSSPDADVVAAKAIVKAAKATIEAVYGEKTWSWFKWNHVVPESGKVLGKLIEQLSSPEMDASASMRTAMQATM